MSLNFEKGTSCMKEGATAQLGPWISSSQLIVRGPIPCSPSPWLRARFHTYRYTSCCEGHCDSDEISSHIFGAGATGRPSGLQPDQLLRRCNFLARVMKTLGSRYFRVLQVSDTRLKLLPPGLILARQRPLSLIYRLIIYIYPCMGLCLFR